MARFWFAFTLLMALVALSVALVLPGNATPQLVVVDRLLDRPRLGQETAASASEAQDVARLAAGARLRWTNSDIASLWTPVSESPERMLRSPRLDLEAGDGIEAVVLEIARAPRSWTGALLWGDGPAPTNGDYARNRRNLSAFPDRTHTVFVPGKALGGERARPPVHLFLDLQDWKDALRSVAVLTRAERLSTVPQGRSRVAVNGESRDVFALRAPGELAWRVAHPTAVELRLGLHVTGSLPAVRVRVTVTTDGREKVLSDQVAQAEGWKDLRLPWPGSAVSVLKIAAESAVPATLFVSDPMLLAATATPGRPNVILYVVDTLRADRVGLYGSKQSSTPFLDQLGHRSLVYDRAYAPATWTKPSIASLLTGQYPRTHGMGARYYSDQLPGDVPTLQTKLRAHGYVTAQFSANPFSGALSNLDRGFDQTLGSDAFAMAEEKVRGEDVSRRLLPWIDAHAQDRFFLYIQTIDPHPPFTAPAAGGAPTLQDAYQQAIRAADREIERLYDRLEQKGIAARTMFVVTADHGEAFGEHGQHGHGQSVYEEEVRVPLLMHWPDTIAPGRRPFPVNLVDLAPTILAEGGVPFDRSLFQGRNLTRPPTSPRPVFVTRFVYPEDSAARNLDRSDIDAVIEFPWKLIATRQADGRDHLELYNLATDPSERQNRAGSPGAPTERLQSMLQAFLRDQALARGRFLSVYGDSAGAMTDVRPRPSAETLERLRSLGYVR